MARLVLGQSSGLLLVRSVSVSGRCYGIPAAEVRCHNTHGEKSDYHSHADIFPFSCGQDSYGQKEALIVGVAGLGDQIERLADSNLYKNRSVRGNNQRRFPGHREVLPSDVSIGLLLG